MTSGDYTVPPSSRYAMALVLAMLTSSLPLPVFAQGVEIVAVNVQTVAKGLRASKLIGHSVTNDTKERIGTIDDIVVGQDSRLFAVLQVGGFLNLGGHRIAVPFDSLVLDLSKDEVTLPGATKEALRKLPKFEFTS